MKVLLVVLLVIFCTFVESEVVSLTTSNFDSKIQKGNWFVKFFAPWCGHCKALAPTWESLGGKSLPNVKIASVDCTVEKDLCAKNQIQSYPSLFLFSGGEVKTKYSGQRTEEALYSFAKEQGEKYPQIQQSGGPVSPLSAFAVFVVAMLVVFYLIHVRLPSTGLHEVQHNRN